MICQILFSEKNKKNVTNLSSAELAQRVLKVKVNGRSCKICPHFAKGDNFYRLCFLSFSKPFENGGCS